MILVVGSGSDQVIPQLLEEIGRSGCRSTFLDRDNAPRYRVHVDSRGGHTTFRVIGPGCTGSRPVGVVFLRRATPGTGNPRTTSPLDGLQAGLSQMLAAATCPAVNPPASALPDYSRPWQLRLLAEAGFQVPRTLVTNSPEAAVHFYERMGGLVARCGVSNLRARPEMMTLESLRRFRRPPISPALLQEYVAGVDYRVHTVGQRPFVTRLIAGGERESNRGAACEGPAGLGDEVLQRCVAFTRNLGLAVSCLDLRAGRDGRLVALGFSAYPEFAVCERISGQPITRSVAEYLAGCLQGDSNVLA